MIVNTIEGNVPIAVPPGLQPPSSAKVTVPLADTPAHHGPEWICSPAWHGFLWGDGCQPHGPAPETQPSLLRPPSSGREEQVARLPRGVPQSIEDGIKSLANPFITSPFPPPPQAHKAADPGPEQEERDIVLTEQGSVPHADAAATGSGAGSEKISSAVAAATPLSLWAPVPTPLSFNLPITTVARASSSSSLAAAAASASASVSPRHSSGFVLSRLGARNASANHSTSIPSTTTVFIVPSAPESTSAVAKVPNVEGIAALGIGAAMYNSWMALLVIMLFFTFYA